VIAGGIGSIATAGCPSSKGDVRKAFVKKALCWACGKVEVVPTCPQTTAGANVTSIKIPAGRITVITVAKVTEEAPICPVRVMMMAGSLLMTTPVILIFFFAQKYFIQGVTLTGMKG
jgi:hypothetical protein